jgi:hypothetical protein
MDFDKTNKQEEEVSGLDAKLRVQNASSEETKTQDGPSTNPVSLQTSQKVKPVVTKKKKQSKKRCGICNRKIKLAMRLKCRCGGIFCTEHKIPSDHNCSQTFKVTSYSSVAHDKLGDRI